MYEFHFLIEKPLHLGVDHAVLVQDAAYLPQRQAVIAKAYALDQIKRRLKGVIAIPTLAADGLDDPHVLIVLEQVGGYTQVFCEITDAILFHDLFFLVYE